MAPEQQRAEQVRNARKKVRLFCCEDKAMADTAQMPITSQLRSFRAHKHTVTSIPSGSQENIPPTAGTGLAMGGKGLELDLEQQQEQGQSRRRASATTTTTTATKRRLRESSSSSSNTTASSPLQPRFAQISPRDQYFPDKPVLAAEVDGCSSMIPEHRDALILPPVPSIPSTASTSASTPTAGLSSDLPVTLSSLASIDPPLFLPAKHARTRSRHVRAGSQLTGSVNSFTQGFRAADAETEVSQRLMNDERGSGSIRAVQPLSPPPPPIQTGFGVGFRFGRSDGDSSAQKEGGKSPRGVEDRELVLPLLATPFPDHASPRDSSLLGREKPAGPSSSPLPSEAAKGVDARMQIDRDDADDGRYGKYAALPDHTYASTPFSFPQSKSFGPTTDVVVATTTSRGAPENLVIPSASSANAMMAVPVPQLTVVPSTPLGDETFGFEFPPLPTTGWSSGVPAAVADKVEDGDGHQDADTDVERRRSGGASDGDYGPDEGGEKDDAEKRFTAFVFGGASCRKSVESPPSPPPVVAAITEPPLENRRKRHSHTRSTSISTRAAFIPAASMGSVTTLLTSDPTGQPSASSTSLLSRSPSPSDSLIDVRGGEQQETIGERRRTLFALEGRDAGRGAGALGAVVMGEGGGDTPRWLAGLQAFAGTGAGEGNRTSQRASRRRSRVSVSEKVEIALPPMDEEDLAEGSVVRDETKCAVGPSTTSNPADGGFPHSPLQAPVSSSGFTARPTDARGNPIPVNSQISATRYIPSPFGFHFPEIVSTATGSSAPSATTLNGLGIGGLFASTSMASQATNLGTLVEEDESEVAAVEPVIEPAGDAERESESMLADLVMTPERASQPAIGAGISPDVSSATSFKIRPLRLLSMSSNSTSFSSTPIDPDAQSIGSRRSLSIEALRSPSSSKAIEAGNFVPPLALSESSKRFSLKRNSAGMGSKLFSSYTNDYVNKRSSVASNATSGSRVLNEVDDITPHTDKDDSLRSFALRRRSVTVSGQSATASGEVDELKQLVAHLEMEKHTMQEDIEGWQSRCQGLEMQLKHEKEQGVFLRERVRKLGDHLSSLSGLATSSTPSSPYQTQTESPSKIQSPTQHALMRNELFKLTSVIAQLNAEKEQARAEAVALRAQLGRDRLDIEPDVSGTLASHSTPPTPVYSKGERSTQIETPRLDRPPTRPPSNYNSPSPSPMARLGPEDDVGRIRAFSFPKGPIPPAATSRNEDNFFAVLQPDTPIRTKYQSVMTVTPRLKSIKDMQDTFHRPLQLQADYHHAA